MDASDSLSSVLADPTTSRIVIEDAVGRFCDLADQRYSLDEWGCLERDMVGRTPHLRPQFKAIAKRQGEFLEKVAKLRLLARSGLEVGSWWRCISSSYDAIAQNLRRLRRSEATLLREALQDRAGPAH
ncbi:hypothetical protein [Pirellulimonas nuda]|uniref:hypothetical protein n=1 Tax=Pirellulimonas nuda TaxID=2528009 RepID=UPI0011A07447|nr:hypothetical protein [Pirellulimonas nuda]